MIETKVLIVGGGPAGSMCGIRLRQHCVDCVIADRARFPRLKLCAGVLTRKSRDVLRSVLGTEKAESLIDSTCRCHEPHLRLWHGKKCFVDCDFSREKYIPRSLRGDDWRFVLVDRPSFDNGLLDYFKSLGGRTVEGDGVRKVDFDNRTAVLASGTAIKYEYLVACDGANSHVEQLLSKHDATFRPKGRNAEAFEINVDWADAPIDGINVCFGYALQTYAWAFAKGHQVCIGTCRLPGARFSAREVMNRFFDDIGLKNRDKYPLQAAMIPFDNAMPLPLYGGHVFFCGDAAGLDEAVTGEGIFYALRSGTDAAEAIAGNAPADYLRSNAYLQALMRKAAKYQKVIASPRLYPLFRAFAGADNRFVGYFYLTQVDHSSLRRLYKIYFNYIREMRL